MRKLFYKFEDGVKFSTLEEAQKYKEKTNLRYEHYLEEMPKDPDRDIQDGCDWRVAGRVRVAVGLKQVDTGNLAARGYYSSDPKSLIERMKREHPELWSDEHRKKILNPELNNIYEKEYVDAVEE